MGVLEEVGRIFEQVRERYVEEFMRGVEEWIRRYAGWSGRVELGWGKRPWIVRIDVYDESGAPVESGIFDISILASVVSREVHMRVEEIINDYNIVAVVAALIFRLNTLVWDLRDEIMSRVIQCINEAGFQAQPAQSKHDRIVFTSGGWVG